MAPEVIMPFIFFTFVLCAWLIATYNKFIKYKNRIEEAWSSIDVALKKRFNLIPNMVSTIEGYGKHESDIIENKYEQVRGDEKVGERMESESNITHSLTNLLAYADAYPDLKASVNYLELQKSLTEIEGDIQNARVRYNKVVARMNTLVESFPASMIARKFGFEKYDYFSLDLATQRELPDIDFNSDK